MSSKIKPRQQKQPRSQVVVDMILHCKGGPHKSRKDKRASNPRKSWQAEQDSANG